MALEKYLEDLKGTNGFKAAGIMNFTGEMLAHVSTDASSDLDLVGATFNDIFRGAHDAAGKVGLQAANETIIKTPNGIIIMVCSGTSAKAHLHYITILGGDGNHALAKMTMEKQMPQIVEEMA